MKKSTLFVAALALSVSTAFAQDLTSKKGEAFLPEAGDWSIGVDADPFLHYIGNMFNGNTNNGSPTFNFLNSNRTIIGKMYSTETMAYRGILRIGMDNTHQTAQIADATAAVPTYPALPAMKEDKMKSANNFIGLGAGMEMRRGKTRLQGFYGVDAMFWMSMSKQTYTYGNALNAATPVTVASSTNFGTNITTDTYGNAARITEMKSGTTIGFGVRGFIGCEYFIVPKISIGAEFGWGIGITSTGASSTSMESLGGAPTTVGTQTVTGNKSGSFTIDTDQNMFGSGTGSLRMNFHF